MEELVRPWREAYRALDPLVFDSRLVDVPDLVPEHVALCRTILPALHQSPSLPSLTPGVDRILSVIVQDTVTAEHESALRPVLPLRRIDAEAPVWCTTTTFKLPDLCHLPARFPIISGTQVESLAATQHDAILEHKTATSTVPQAEAYRCFQALLRGRESSLFRWDTATRSMQTQHTSLQIDALSDKTVQGLVDLCMPHGTNLRLLEIFSNGIFASLNKYDATMLAFAGTIRCFLEYCSDKLPMSEVGRSGTASLVKLCRAMDSVARSARWLVNLVNLKSESSSSSAVSTVHLLNDVVQEVANQTGIFSFHDQFVRVVLQRLSVPVLQDVSARIGLSPFSSMVSSGCLVVTDPARHNYVDLSYQKQSRPLLITDNCEEQILDMEKGMLFLQQHGDAQFLKQLRGMQSMSLQLSLMEAELHDLQDRARCWNNAVSATTDDQRNEAAKASQAHTWQHTRSKNHITQDLHEWFTLVASSPSMASRDNLAFEAALQMHDTQSSSFNLEQVLYTCLATPVRVQSVLIHDEVLRVLLHDMKLQEHLELAQQVFLLQNGIYATRLCDTLFRLSDHDQDMSRMQSRGRNSWPPQPAKISAATRAILSKSIASKYTVAATHAMADKEFLGRFGFRLSMELEHGTPCLRDSLDAFSFLQFSFHPPKPIDLIMTNKSIQLYSRVNQFLIMLLRLVHVTQAIASETRLHRTRHHEASISERFRIEATHFVQSFTAHIFETVIVSRHQTFMATFDMPGITIEQLRNAHILMLEQICHCAFLSSKMSEIQALLRAAFSAILSFSRLSMHEREAGGSRVVELYRDYDTRARKLLSIFRGAETAKFDSFAAGISARFSRQ